MRRVALAILAATLLVSCQREGLVDTGPDRTDPARDFDEPCPEIVSGPMNGSIAYSIFSFRWVEPVPAAGREWILFDTEEYSADTGGGELSLSAIIAWMDTVTYRTGTDIPWWTETPDDSVRFTEMPPTPFGVATLFGVRCFDGDGNRAPLSGPENVRYFYIREDYPPPVIHLRTSYGDCVTSHESVQTHDVFRAPIRFAWRVEVQYVEAPLVEAGWAIGAPEGWTPVDPSGGIWPPESEDGWLPDPGPVSFFVRTLDSLGAEAIFEYALDVHEMRGRGVLAVLDTDEESLLDEDVLPRSFDTVERAMIAYWLEDRPLRLHQTGAGTAPPSAAALEQASTIVWFHTADLQGSGHSSWAGMFQEGGPERSMLATWHEAGGNLVLCGLNPVHAMEYFQERRECRTTGQALPIVFSITISDTTLMPHFAATGLSVDRVEGARRAAYWESPEGRLSVARSALPWLPDLDFDPLRHPFGPDLGGFGFWDDGILPRGDAVVAYTANDTADPVAILTLRGAGMRGSAAYLGFHPYFLQDPQVRAMFGALLDAFGEHRIERGPAPDPPGEARGGRS